MPSVKNARDENELNVSWKVIWSAKHVMRLRVIILIVLFASCAVPCKQAWAQFRGATVTIVWLLGAKVNKTTPPYRSDLESQLMPTLHLSMVIEHVNQAFIHLTFMHNTGLF